MGQSHDIRLKVLKMVKRFPHRYDQLRVLSMSVSMGLLFLIPLSGLARIDLWQGRHYLLYSPASFKHGLAGVIIGVAMFYVVTLLSNVMAGRMFCGWGCPVGQISRFGEAVGTPGLKRPRRLRAQVEGAIFSLAFVLSTMAWCVDLRVLWLGSTTALTWAWGLLTVAVVGAYLHGRWWRWEFCKSVCPIGLYYSFVSPAYWFGVHFRNQENTCIDCNACDHVCPVDLKPRDLMQPVAARSGVSINDAPGRNHCLECGDCIRACERMIELKGHEPVPLLLGYHRGPQRIDPFSANTGSEDEQPSPS